MGLVTLPPIVETEKPAFFAVELGRPSPRHAEATFGLAILHDGEGAPICGVVLPPVSKGDKADSPPTATLAKTAV